MSWIILFLAGLFEVCWAVGLKYTDGFTRPLPTLLTVAAMIVSIGLLGLAMKELPLGTAYAIWTGVGDEAAIAREEIFGPCTLVMPFDSEEEVIKRANSTCYGLAASIYTQNVTRAHRVAARMEVGLVWVNSWFLRDLRTPFGGSKQSGIGREGGVHSLEFYTELKNICIKL